MDQRIESFLGDVLALAGEEPEEYDTASRALSGRKCNSAIQMTSRPQRSAASTWQMIE
jgi:hypothetical protein